MQPHAEVAVSVCMPFRIFSTSVKRRTTAKFADANTNDGKQVAASFRLGVYQKKNDIQGMSFFFGSPMRNRTADSAVRGQRLNRLTMRPFFIVIEISLFMITYFFVFCKCLYARCGKILKFCLSGKDLNIFFKKNVHRNLAYFIFRDILAPKSLLRG